jgi:hypothetical protein
LYQNAFKRRDIRVANDHLYAAAIYADAAISRGLTTPIALWVTSLLTRSGTQYNIDVRNSPRYRVFHNLWRAMDNREAEMDAEDNKRSAKVAKAPNAYKCAAKGCGVEGTSKTALPRCAGTCPSGSKPSYCSKDCQKKVETFSSKHLLHALNCWTGLARSQTDLQAGFKEHRRSSNFRRQQSCC